jgi:hypothetical protein
MDLLTQAEGSVAKILDTVEVLLPNWRPTPPGWRPTNWSAAAGTWVWPWRTSC